MVWEKKVAANNPAQVIYYILKQVILTISRIQETNASRTDMVGRMAKMIDCLFFCFIFLE